MRPLLVLQHLVEHHNGVVQRVAEDGEQGDDRGRADLEPEQRVETGGEHQVVDNRGQGPDGHAPLQAPGQVDGNGQEEPAEGGNRL